MSVVHTTYILQTSGVCATDIAPIEAHKSSESQPPPPGNGEVSVPLRVPRAAYRVREKKEVSRRDRPAPAAAAPRRTKPPPPEWAQAAAAALRDAVKAAHPGAPTPRALSAWAAEIAKITEPADVPATIAWLFSPANAGEFAFVVHSGRALREKYSRIRSAMERSARPRRQRSRGDERQQQIDDVFARMAARDPEKERIADEQF
jgi:hypothetical protein